MPPRGKALWPRATSETETGEKGGTGKGRSGATPVGGTAVKEEEWGRDTQGTDVLEPPPWLLMWPEGVQGLQGTDQGGAW